MVFTWLLCLRKFFMQYTELQVTTNFSFLQGASHAEELMQTAAAFGYTEIAVTDVNTFAGIVRAHVAAKKSGIRLIVGVHLQLLDGYALLAYPENKKGYAAVCALLTEGNMRAEKGNCFLYKADVVAFLKEDLQLVLLPPHTLDASFKLSPQIKTELLFYRQYFTGKLSLAVYRLYHGNDAKLLQRFADLCNELQVPMMACNNVFYHDAERRQLQDVLTCIKEKCTIQTAGELLYANAERFLKSEKEMARLFIRYPQALERTQQISSACSFNLAELKYEYPEEIYDGHGDPQAYLTELTWQGAKDFYGEQVPKKVCKNIEQELAFIAQLNYAPYFLTVYDIVRFARSQNILCQGRGSAANSTVCFCLGITSVNPAKFDLLFERFLSTARNEPPDIDVDFEHERREEVIQYIYQKYGRDRAAIVATVTQQHEKGAIRDVAKALGFSVDIIEKISSSILRSGINGFEDVHFTSLGLQVNDHLTRKLIELTNMYIGFPRQLGQHTGGFVISRNPLTNLCPVIHARMQDRTNLEWNKDDIEALAFLKIDVLALGMLTCIQKAFTLINQKYAKQYTLATIPQDDVKVYDMICEADTIGVFQIESRAQQSMLPRLKPRCFYDLVIEVAIVRPGPIQGDMVHPYLRRRNGEEAVTYPSKELEEILGRTLGVPLFQEQAMKIAIVAAGFTADEADGLRRSMATFKIKGEVSYFERKLVDGMIGNGYTPEYAQRVFRQLEGFGSYGFPESHAASFALLVYISAWIKCHYPDVFCCALLNSLPMGFYQPAQIVRDAQQHAVIVRQVDVNFSQWDNTLEEQEGKYFALRLGFRHINGIRLHDAEILLAARKEKFTYVLQLTHAGLSDAALENLADADAFRSLGLDRRQALWQISIKDKPSELFSALPLETQTEMQQVNLPDMHLAEHVMQDYASIALSLKAHPVHFLREKLNLLRVSACSQMQDMKNGMPIKVAGIVLVRQRPETSKGVWFITLEDEVGIANLVIFPQVFLQYKKEITHARLLMVEGKLQVEGKVIHVIVSKCFNLTSMLGTLLTEKTQKPVMPAFSRADEMTHGLIHKPKNGVEKVIPGGRIG